MGAQFLLTYHLCLRLLQTTENEFIIRELKVFFCKHGNSTVKITTISIRHLWWQHADVQNTFPSISGLMSTCGKIVILPLRSCRPNLAMSR